MRTGKTLLWLERLAEQLNRYKTVFVATSKESNYYTDRLKKEFDLDIEVTPRYLDNKLSGYGFSKI